MKVSGTLVSTSDDTHKHYKKKQTVDLALDKARRRRTRNSYTNMEICQSLLDLKKKKNVPGKAVDCNPKIRIFILTFGSTKNKLGSQFL